MIRDVDFRAMIPAVTVDGIYYPISGDTHAATSDAKE